MFRLSIPRHVDLIAAARQVAERAAQCAGFDTGESGRIASSVGRAFDAILAIGGGDARDASEPIDLRIERNGAHLDIWLRCRTAEWDRTAGAAGQDETLRAGVDSVEFGREGDVAWCHLRHALPTEKTDHECE